MTFSSTRFTRASSDVASEYSRSLTIWLLPISFPWMLPPISTTAFPSRAIRSASAGDVTRGSAICRCIAW